MTHATDRPEEATDTMLDKIDALLAGQTSNLVTFAEGELRRIEAGDSLYGDMLPQAVMRMVRLLSAEGHSGMSASVASSIASRLMAFKPLSPLTGEPDEWNEVTDGLFQNRRYSAVFKKDGRAYNIEGRVFREPSGACYTSGGSRVDVSFPYEVPERPEYVDVDENGKPLLRAPTGVAEARAFVEAHDAADRDGPGLRAVADAFVALRSALDAAPASTHRATGALSDGPAVPDAEGWRNAATDPFPTTGEEFWASYKGRVYVGRWSETFGLTCKDPDGGTAIFPNGLSIPVHWRPIVPPAPPDLATPALKEAEHGQ